MLPKGCVMMTQKNVKLNINIKAKILTTDNNGNKNNPGSIECVTQQRHEMMCNCGFQSRGRAETMN